MLKMIVRKPYIIYTVFPFEHFYTIPSSDIILLIFFPYEEQNRTFTAIISSRLIFRIKMLISLDIKKILHSDYLSLFSPSSWSSSQPLQRKWRNDNKVRVFSLELILWNILYIHPSHTFHTLSTQRNIYVWSLWLPNNITFYMLPFERYRVSFFFLTIPLFPYLKLSEMR